MKPYATPPEGLVVEVDGPVLRLRLDRPDRRNAITDDMVDALVDTIEAAGGDESVRVIALTGTGEHFCSGFDLGLRGQTEAKPRPGATQREMRGGVNRLIPTMLETQTPIVTAATGYVIGLGLNLVLASDFAVVADDARLRAPFAGMGFTPDSGASWLIPRLVGVARAKEMLMLSREVTGVEAAEWGLVHRSAPAKSVTEVAGALVHELAGAATVAVGLTKLLVQRSLTVDLERHLADEALAIELSSRSADFQEYARARKDRREPDFEGR
ncbi:MAG: enoyl-CoA hydratase/isomerase family protein [Acidimicrobiia bacterium]